MSDKDISKYLDSYYVSDTDLELGAFPEKPNPINDDDDFKMFVEQKYGALPESYNIGKFGKKSGLTTEERDYAEYELGKRDYESVSSVVHRIGNTQPKLMWGRQGIQYNTERSYSKLLNGDFTAEDVMAKANTLERVHKDKVNKLAIQSGYRPEDMEEWYARTDKGHITGTVRTIRDMMNVYKKAAVPAIGTVAGTTGIGAATGSVVPGLGTAAGATSGLRAGLVAVNRIEVPVAVAADTFERTMGNSVREYIQSHPNATTEELKRAKDMFVKNAAVSAVFEAGMAEFFAGYVGKGALMIPGVQKIAKPMLKSVMKELPKRFTVAQWAAFAGEFAKITGAEIATEELQGMFESYCNQMLNETNITSLEEQARNKDLSPEERDRIEFQLMKERKLQEENKFTKETAWETAKETFQGSGILAITGGAIHAKSLTYQKVADSINAKLEEADRAAGIEPEAEVKQDQQQTTTLKGGVEKNEYADMDTKQLTKEETASGIRAKELEGLISSTQERINKAEELGLSQNEVESLQKDLYWFEKEKQEKEFAMRKIGTEKAIKQATEQTDRDIEAVNDKIEKTNADIEKNDAKLEAAKKAGKDTTKLEARAKKLESSLEKLETKQESLMADKTKLETRDNVESVLKGKKTQIGSTVLTNIEKRAEEAIKNNDAKATARINKIQARNAADKVKALIKSLKQQEDQFVKGYVSGAKEQVRETKDIRKALYKALREQGVHRKELYKFDTITKDITTLQDLEVSQKRLVNKIKEVFEERSKAAALRKTEQLMKLAKPFKAGKTPKGKMTADIQNKVNRLFSFVPRSIYELGFDIQDLVSKFSKDPTAKNNAETIVKLAISTNNANIIANQKEINDIKNDKESKKIKWEGPKKDREGQLKGEEIPGAVKEYKTEIPAAIKDQEVIDKIKTNLNNRIAEIFNFVNMGLNFKSLTLEVKESLFKEGMDEKGNYGKYNFADDAILIFGKAKETLVHEVGHYFDRLIARMMGYGNEMMFSYIANIKDPNSKKIFQKYADILKSERARIKKSLAYKRLTKEGDREYALNPSEIFARLFTKLFTKMKKEELSFTETPDSFIGNIDELIYEIPDSTIHEFHTLLNDIANYKENGLAIFKLEQENEELERQNELIQKQGEGAIQEEMLANLPDDIAELIYELSIAADLKNKSAADIMKFNDYVETLIREGRDLRQQKLDAQKERREKAIGELKGKIEKYAPKAKDNKLHINKFLELYNYIGANWKSKLNMFFGKDIAEQFNVIKEETERDSFVFEEKAKFRQKAKEIYGFKDIAEMGKLTAEYTADRDIYMANEKDGKVKTRLDKMQVISAWIYYQNEEGRARLENMYDPMELDRMFSKLNDKDKAFADLMIETAESYYDRVNAIFREDRGLDLPRRERYFPFAVDKTVTDIPTFMDSSFGTVGGLPSFTKTVTSSKNIALDLTNPLSTLFAHISNVGEYLYLYPKTKEIGIIFNDDRIKRRVRLLYGEKNFKNFYAMVNEISLASRMRDNFRIVGFWDNMASKYIVSKIAMKPTIAIKQLLSFVNYAEDIPVAAFVKYQADFFKNPVASIKFMMNDKYLQSRFGQGSEAFELSRALEDSQYKKTGKFVDWLTLNVRLGDIGAICLGGYSQVKYLMNEKGMTKEQAFMKFRESTANSQQFGSTSSLSNIQNYGRSNGFARMFFAFSNTPFQYHRKLVDAAIQVSRGEMSKTDFAKTVAIYQFINPLLYTWATSLTPLKYLLADDDEDKEEAREELLLDTVGGVLTANMNLIPLFTDIPNDIFMRATGQKQYPVDAIPFGRESRHIVNTTVDLIRLSLQGDFEDIKVDDVLKAINDGGAMWKGLPLDYATSAVDGVVKLRDEEARLQGMLQLAGYTSKRSEAIAKYAK